MAKKSASLIRGTVLNRSVSIYAEKCKIDLLAFLLPLPSSISGLKLNFILPWCFFVETRRKIRKTWLGGVLLPLKKYGSQDNCDLDGGAEYIQQDFRFILGMAENDSFLHFNSTHSSDLGILV